MTAAAPGAAEVTISDEAFRGGDYTDSDLYEYIGAFAQAHPDWIDVGHEIRRIWNLAIEPGGDEVEEESRIDEIFSAAAVGGWHAAFAAMAYVLDVNQQELERAIGAAAEPYSDGRRDPPFGIDNLPEQLRLVREDKGPSTMPPPEPPK